MIVGHPVEVQRVKDQSKNRDDDSDAVWMALTASDGDVDVTRWVMDCGGGDGVAEYELWTEDEIAAISTGSENSEHSIFDVSDLVLGPSNTSVDDEAYADSLPDLISISDSLDSNIEGVENNRGAESVDANESGDSLFSWLRRSQTLPYPHLQRQNCTTQAHHDICPLTNINLSTTFLSKPKCLPQLMEALSMLLEKETFVLPCQMDNPRLGFS